MRYSVVLTAAAADDFRKLDGSLKEPVAKQLRKLETAPRLGEHLGNRAGLDLTGYYKLYAAKKSSASCTGSSTKRSWLKSWPLESEKISRFIKKPSSD